jgi:hypothetical protein
MVAPGTDTSAVFTGGASHDIGWMIDPLKRLIVDGDMIVVLEYPTDFTLMP